ANLGLLLWEENLPVHQSLLQKKGTWIINTTHNNDRISIDAAKIARNLGNAVLLNLVLLGAAIKQGSLIFTAEECETAIKQLAPKKFIEQNLAAFHKGLNS
ncbi:MAG: pyruvate ferredoxin oxidoreductase, partial [Deltaproteobacteria bacterium]